MRNQEIPYTHEERTVRRWTVAQAIEAARIRLEGRYKMCTNALYERGRRLEAQDKITLVQLNDLADRIVDDSNHYAVRF